MQNSRLEILENNLRIFWAAFYFSKAHFCCSFSSEKLFYWRFIWNFALISPFNLSNSLKNFKCSPHFFLNALVISINLCVSLGFLWFLFACYLSSWIICLFRTSLLVDAWVCMFLPSLPALACLCLRLSSRVFAGLACLRLSCLPSILPALTW